MTHAGESPVYDRIGAAYTVTRRPDPRIAAAIAEALGDVRTALNVGAGAGAYEPIDRPPVSRWAERHGALRDRASLDLGYRLVVADRP